MDDLREFKMNDTKRSNGFTIVELLIVIVVIAILAAITIVAYNGIQNRAKNTQQISAMSTYVKGLGLYAASNNNQYPTAALACFDGTSTCWSGATQSASETLVAGLRQHIGSVPVPPYIALLANGTVGTYNGYYLLYRINDTATSCPEIGGTYLLNTSTADGLRTCRVAIPLPV